VRFSSRYAMGPDDTGDLFDGLWCWDGSVQKSECFSVVSANTHFYAASGVVRDDSGNFETGYFPDDYSMFVDYFKSRIMKNLDQLRCRNWVYRRQWLGSRCWGYLVFRDFPYLNGPRKQQSPPGQHPAFVSGEKVNIVK